MSEQAREQHRRRVAALAGQLARSSGPVRLAKPTSNLFRPREDESRCRLDVSGLDHVIGIDRERQVAEVEGMITYSSLVDATLPHGFAPAVVPELKSITVGGAISGVGIESGSFRYGLVHHTMREIDVLVADGRVLSCSRELDPELCYGLPNSYGSLGYVTRAVIDLIPVQPWVRLERWHFSDPRACFDALAAECANPGCDWLDAVYFEPGRFVMVCAYKAAELPAAIQAGDYTWMQAYWKSLETPGDDWLSTHDYLWRWDTDWFWCSKNVGAHLKPVRWLLGRKRLSSITYQKIMRASHRWPLKAIQYFTPRTESVIQDVDIPIANAAAFLEEFEAEIGIRPVWICPFVVPEADFSLFELRTDTPYINFGFWDMVRSDRPDGWYNARVEALVKKHGGKKSLYSRSTYDEQTFWTEYDRDTYQRLKQRCDPEGRFPGLYEKAVGRK